MFHAWQVLLREEGAVSSISWVERGWGEREEREREGACAWEREREREHKQERASLLAVGVYFCMCVLPFVCVCCVMDTFSGSTNYYSAAKPSQWRRRRGWEVRFLCCLFLPLTLDVAILFSLSGSCSCCFMLLAFRRKFISHVML